MTTIEKAGAPQQPASQIIDELSPIVPHEMSGRELLRKRLRERVEQLEQRGRS